MFLASVAVFSIMRILPGDIAALTLSGGGEVAYSIEVWEALREEWGLNDSLILQYGRWLWSMVNGDFGGQSLLYGQPIQTLVARQLPVTLSLTLYTVALSLLVSVPLGILAALKWNRWQEWRRTEGQRPTSLTDGETTAARQEANIWRNTMEALHGQDSRLSPGPDVRASV